MFMAALGGKQRSEPHREYSSTAVSWKITRGKRSITREERKLVQTRKEAGVKQNPELTDRIKEDTSGLASKERKE